MSRLSSIFTVALLLIGSTAGTALAEERAYKLPPSSDAAYAATPEVVSDLISDVCFPAVNREWKKPDLEKLSLTKIDHWVTKEKGKNTLSPDAAYASSISPRVLMWWVTESGVNSCTLDITDGDMNRNIAAALSALRTEMQSEVAKSEFDIALTYDEISKTEQSSMTLANGQKIEYSAGGKAITQADHGSFWTITFLGGNEIDSSDDGQMKVPSLSIMIMKTGG